MEDRCGAGGGDAAREISVRVEVSDGMERRVGEKGTRGSGAGCPSALPLTAGDKAGFSKARERVIEGVVLQSQPHPGLWEQGGDCPVNSLE